MCGENMTYQAQGSILVGSPPRVRGKPCHSTTPSPHTRITPACAGKTPRLGAAGVLQKDHPRVCGENKTFCPRLSSPRGSPPRVRGKRARRALDAALHRITPACAGKTRSQPRGSRRCQDHPRVCGENYDSLPRAEKHLGSPPRVRGKLPVFFYSKFPIGDHPRVCGENW